MLYFDNISHNTSVISLSLVFFISSLKEREMMAAHFHDLKGQMNKLREGERARLTKLTLESNAAIKELKRKAEQVSSN